MRKIKQTLVMLLAAVMLLGTVTTAMAATAMSDQGLGEDHQRRGRRHLQAVPHL